MYISVDKTGTVTGFKDILQATLADKAVKGLLILACDANGFSPEVVDETLQAIPIPIMGGIFPELIFGTDKVTNGTIVAGLKTAPQIQIIPGLSDESVDFDELIYEKFPEIGSAKNNVCVCRWPDHPHCRSHRRLVQQFRSGTQLCWWRRRFLEL